MKVATFILTLSLVLAACIQPLPGEPTAAVPATPPSAETTPETTPETPPSTAPESGGEDNLVGTQWVLESFGTLGAETAVVGETPLTLEFSTDAQMGGNAGCNSFGGSYQVQDNTLVLSEIVSTLVACVDNAVMEQEIQYLDALQTVSEYQIEGDRLTITYDEGQGVLNYMRATSSPTEPEAPVTATPAPEAELPSIISASR